MSILLIPVWVFWWLSLASIFTGFTYGLVLPFRQFVNRIYRINNVRRDSENDITSALIVAGFALWFLTSIILAGAA